jgi:UDP-N-acetylmuramoylalanine--D-glutamate ligase
LIELAGARVTVMGLGLHGGGAASAHYLLSRGADVTVTDLRTAADLAEPLESLDGRVRLVLGQHELQDFERADFVVKNPAVPRHSEYLAAARRIETDISLFLAEVQPPLICVTGTKGKSSTASAVHAALTGDHPHALLGGNITTSPLRFIDSVSADVPVVLELSSFQLGDLAIAGDPPGEALQRLRPQVSVLTNMYRDHQDYYPDMDTYVRDKVFLARATPSGGRLVLPADCAYTPRFLAEARCPALFVVPRREERPNNAEPDDMLPYAVHPAVRPWLSHAGGFAVAAPDGRWLLQREVPETENVALGADDPNEADNWIVGHETAVVGRHMRRNLATAGLALAAWGMDAESARGGLARFPGIEHRLEFVGRAGAVSFYNDSAATIPEAALEAVTAFDGPVRLIAGGSDKQLDVSLFEEIMSRVAELALLAGSASQRIIDHLGENRGSCYGPYNNLNRCISEVLRRVRPGDTVLLSPGCASFGMFRNEFDRGRQFKQAVRAHIEARASDQSGVDHAIG